jgi:uncharacterized protein (DUF58 family)
MFLEYISQNWFGYLLLLVVLAYIIYLSITRQWTKIREFAYKTMLCAERTFSNEEGEMKFDFVVGLVYRNLPVWMKLFIRQENIRKFVQMLYDYAKDFLDDGIINKSIKK